MAKISVIVLDIQIDSIISDIQYQIIVLGKQDKKTGLERKKKP